MKNLFIIVFILFLNSCGKERNEWEDYPICVQNYIESYSDFNVSGHASVSEYIYHNETVYFLTAVYVDDTNKVYDKGCNVICENGGLGNIETCNDWDEADFVEIIWEKN